jgi:hypothetical protein
MKKPTPATKARQSPGKTPAKAPAPGAAHMTDEMKWKAQDALNTLKRAEEIRKDPQLMRHVHAHAHNEREHLNKIVRRKMPA